MIELVSLITNLKRKKEILNFKFILSNRCYKGRLVCTNIFVLLFGDSQNNVELELCINQLHITVYYLYFLNLHFHTTVTTQMLFEFTQIGPSYLSDFLIVFSPILFFV